MGVVQASFDPHLTVNGAAPTGRHEEGGGGVDRHRVPLRDAGDAHYLVGIVPYDERFSRDCPAVDKVVVRDLAQLVGETRFRFDRVRFAATDVVQPRLQYCGIGAVAGMDGALPSVVAGLVGAPVIAVPTSVGYGASLGGLTALFAMLTSCSDGISVVNIDNGFGAGCQAHLINRLASKP